MPEWEPWFTRIALHPTKQERYTATLLKTLHELLETAPFAWALTGGTALQSTFHVSRRRYSTDIEIVTAAPLVQVEDWLRSRSLGYRPVNDRILSAQLTPDGQLYIIHDYPPQDLASAKPQRQPFNHYPFARDPPPGTLNVPMLGRAFLAATKIFGIQQDGRGGERSKDANDLAIALADENLQEVRAALSVYAKHRAATLPEDEIVRRAGVWLRICATTGYSEFLRWRRRIAPAGSTPPTVAELEAAARQLENILGKSIQPTPGEVRRQLLHSIRIKPLAEIAKTAGYTGKPSVELEKMYDFLAAKVVVTLSGPPPTTAEALAREMRQAVGLPPSPALAGKPGSVPSSGF